MFNIFSESHHPFVSLNLIIVPPDLMHEHCQFAHGRRKSHCRFACIHCGLYSLAQLLQAKRITTRHAGLVPDTLESLGFRNLDRSANQNVQLYRMLLAGRTQIIVGDTPAGVAYYSRLLQIPAGTLRQIPLELFRSSLYIAFSRDSSEAVVTRWAEALDQLRSSGKLEQIRLAYE